jgi:uncharacterized membrane protein (UPF0127 family)
MVPGTIMAALAVVVLLGVAGCADDAARPPLRTVPMTIGSRTFTLEVADTDATREHGLMKRDAMPPDHGMIFVFDYDAERSFWMKNTRIPLDIIYVNSAGRVVSIASMKPYDWSPVPSHGAAKYAIELNVGVASQTGVKPGDILTIPPDAKDPKREGT